MFKTIASRCAAAVVPAMFATVSAASAGGSLPSVNVDFDFNFPGEVGTGAPAAAWGAAASQDGVWNLVSFGVGPFALAALDGSPSPVTISRTAIQPALLINVGGSGNYAKLVYDSDRIDAVPVTYTFNGLPAGEYIVYTYAAAPSFTTYATRVTVNGVQQNVVGAPIDQSLVEGQTHARHQVTHPGGPLQIVVARASLSGVVNGFQIVAVPPPPVCLGDANGDNAVNFADVTSALTTFASVCGPGPCPGDADHNGAVTFEDVTTVLANWGDSCP